MSGDAQRARLGQFQAATQRRTVDRGDHRLPQCLDAAIDFDGEPGELAHGERRGAVEVANVGAGAEGARAATGEEGAAPVVVVSSCTAASVRNLSSSAASCCKTARLSALSASGRLSVSTTMPACCSKTTMLESDTVGSQVGCGGPSIGRRPRRSMKLLHVASEISSPSTQPAARRPSFWQH